MKVIKTSETTWQTEDGNYRITNQKAKMQMIDRSVTEFYQVTNTKTGQSQWFKTVTEAKQYIKSCY